MQKPRRRWSGPGHWTTDEVDVSDATGGDFGEVLSKFRWAKHHGASLDFAVTDYVAQGPYVSVVEDQTHAEAYKVVARLRYPPPAAIAHILTDVLNSLHGTLDYLAWQLALREGIGAPDRHTVFPIITKDAEQNAGRAAVKIVSGRGRTSETSLVADPAVIGVLDSVQPYHLPESERATHFLEVLRVLNGQSKHRHPAVLVSTIDEGMYPYNTSSVYGAKVDAVVTMVTANFGSLKDGDELAWIPHAGAPEGGPPEYDDFPSTVSLEQFAVHSSTGEVVPMMVILEEITNFIADSILEPLAELPW